MMKTFDRSKPLLALAGLIAGFIILLLLWQFSSPANTVYAASIAQKPINNWYVCRDLGIGFVPGLGEVRQRLKLCHDGEGWEVYTYCTQPLLPAPPVGRTCTRINSNTYRCGANNQLLREYRILQTPTATFPPLRTATPTGTVQVQTQTPTATSRVETQFPTLTWTPRTQPGGSGNLRAPGYYASVEIAIFLLAVLGVFLLLRVKTE